MNGRLVELACLLALYCIIVSEAVFKECISCEGVSCPGTNDTCSYVYYDYCGCCAYCAKSEGSRCGGKMNRWGSCRPDLRCMYRLGSVYNEEKFGFCEDSRCAQKVCGYRQRCSVQLEGHRPGLQCVCPEYRCKDKQNPVCGYNGVTYSSVCGLQQTECERGVFIGLKHKGGCGKAGSSSAPVSSTSSLKPVGWDISPAEETKKCLFDGKVYLPGQAVEQDDPCQSATCTTSGRVLFHPIPGCGGMN